MGYSLFLGEEIYDAKGTPFGVIERFSKLGNEVVLEVKLSKKVDEIHHLLIPLSDCNIKGQQIKTKKSIRAILSVEKKRQKSEIKEEKQRLLQILEKRRRLSEPETVEPVISEVKTATEEKVGIPSPADWVICPHCDHALKEPYRFCPYCSATLPYCPKCGKNIKKDFVGFFCPWCGHKL